MWLKFCRFTRQTEQKQKREKQRKRKMWQEKVERNCKGLCKDGGEAKRFRAGQERRCGKWIRINISSSIAWLLRKNIPIIQSRPAVNVSLMHFVDFFLGGLKRSHLVGAFHQTANDFFLLSGDAFFFLFAFVFFSIASLSFKRLISHLRDTVFRSRWYYLKRSYWCFHFSCSHFLLIQMYSPS